MRDQDVVTRGSGETHLCLVTDRQMAAGTPPASRDSRVRSLNFGPRGSAALTQFTMHSALSGNFDVLQHPTTTTASSAAGELPAEREHRYFDHADPSTTEADKMHEAAGGAPEFLSSDFRFIFSFCKVKYSHELEDWIPCWDLEVGKVVFLFVVPPSFLIFLFCGRRQKIIACKFVTISLNNDSVQDKEWDWIVSAHVSVMRESCKK